MPYDFLPKVAISLADGNLRTKTANTQPRVLVLAPADSGLTYETFTVTNSGGAESEFGSNNDLMKGYHEVVAQGAGNVALMRIGGKQGKVVITDSAAGTLTITPEYRDADILALYSLVIVTNDDGTNRYLIWDIDGGAWLYDSEEILVLDEGVIEVTDASFGIFTVGDISDPASAPTLEVLDTPDFTPVGAVTLATVAQTDGADGTSVSLVEKYAALNTAYHLLDFKDADYVIAKGVYLNDQNVANTDSCSFFKGVPAPGATNDSLGYVWQYVYEGKKYTYFSDSATYFADVGTAAAATRTVNTDLVLTALVDGTGGNSISYVSDASGASGPTVTISEPTATTLKISVVDDGSGKTNALVTAINAALAAFTMANGQLASSIVHATGGSGSTAIITVVLTSLAGGAGGHVLTHAQLTGDTIPSAVSTRFAAGADGELREVNFAHQLGSFLHLGSSQWKAMLGAMSVKGPTAFTRAAISSWVGNPPTLTALGLDEIISATGDNGSGIFGIKFIAGKAISSNGYRAGMIEGGTSTDGYAYGGLILTVGASLPNGSDFAYGVDDDDEAVDANNKPVDIGKYLHFPTDWLIHRNAFNGGTTYRGSVEASLLGLLTTIPPNEEPIGISYPLKKVTSLPKVHSVQMNQLSQFRMCPLKLEEGVGYIFAGFHTGAHPLDSDFVDSSTMRSVNKMADGIRRISKPFLGKAFDAYRLTSLQQSIDVFIKQARTDGLHQGARAPLSFTRSGRVLGKLDINLKMVPPFSIKEINVPFSLAADETELA